MNATPKALWAAIVVLALAVAGLGGTLLWQQRSARNAVAPPAAPRMAQPTPLDASPGAARGPVRAPEGAARPPSLAASTPSLQATAPPALPATAPSQLTPQPAPQVVPPPRPAQPAVRAPASAAPACATCGTVQSVAAVQRAGATRYQVTVRMRDGRLRQVETRIAPPIGKAVILRNGVLRPIDRRL